MQSELKKSDAFALSATLPTKILKTFINIELFRQVHFLATMHGG